VSGADDSPGTNALPFKTLSRAAIAARAGDTVNLRDGTWDPSIEVKFASMDESTCGVSAGVAFASNVTLRAVHAGAARIISAGYHGLCMSGGLIDGLRFDCSNSYRPIIETQQGALSIRGSSLRNCNKSGIDISGTAQVTVGPGSLSDYSEYPNYAFVSAREQSQLTIDGGNISYAEGAIDIQDAARVIVHGVTFASQDPSVLAGIAIAISGSLSQLSIDGGTRFTGAAAGVEVYDSSADISIDDMAFTQGGLAILINETATTGVPHIAINRLVTTDNNGPDVIVAGSYELSITNSTFTRCGNPSIILNGSGSATVDSLTFIQGGYGLYIDTDESGDGLAVNARNVSVTGSQYSGVLLLGHANDTFDFGTARSPGNNVFSGNNLSAYYLDANFSFSVPAGVVLQAVGNIWDANQQGSDVDGLYRVGTAGVPLDVVSGAGPNYLSRDSSAGKLRLAE